MKQDYDVIIAGGGLNGPLLALALAKAGLSVAVVDARPATARADQGFDGRAYAMALASVRMLSALGLWAELAPHATAMTEIKAAQGHAYDATFPLFLHFNSAENEDGPVGHMVEDRFLYRTLLTAMHNQDGITHLPATEVTGQNPAADRITVTLSDGQSLSARLLVGADGRGSGTAARAGIRRSGHDYGQTALVAAIAHEKPHHGIAYQLFLPGGPLAILPLSGNRSSIVWSEPTARARVIAGMDDADFMATLRPRFGDFLGPITLAGPRFCYPLSLTLANDYVAERVALIGDAAHGVHPIAGQGLNLGLRDVAALAETLVDAHRRGEDLGEAGPLLRYQSWRRPDATFLALGMDGVNTLFSNDNPALRLVRGVGMGVVNAIGPLRRHFMRTAAGLTLDPMPKLLTGRGL